MMIYDSFQRNPFEMELVKFANLFIAKMAKAFPGISTSEVRKKLRYMLPPSKTDPKDTPKYT